MLSTFFEFPWFTYCRLTFMLGAFHECLVISNWLIIVTSVKGLQERGEVLQLLGFTAGGWGGA